MAGLLTRIIMATATRIITTPKALHYRLVTAAVVIGLCGFAVIRGWSILQFEQAQARLASNEHGVENVDRWIGAPGLTVAALDASLAKFAGKSDIDSAAKREQWAAALLSVRPLSSGRWLLLAEMQLITSAPYERVLAALRMSSVTGPNEGVIMWERGIFGLLNWQGLPPDGRQRAIDDLAGAIRGAPLGSSEMAVARAVLRSKTQETRTTIVEQLKVEGVSPAALSQMGL